MSQLAARQRLGLDTVRCAFVCVLYSVLFCNSSAHAAEILKADVSNQRKIYRLHLEVTLRASAQNVWQVLTDFARISRLSPSIIESQVLPSVKQDSVRVRTVINDCIFIFCQEIERVEDVYVVGEGQLVANVVEELSNIKSGRATWRLIPEGDRTRVQYRGRLELTQYVPPIIGSYLVRRKLLEGITTTLHNIERISQANAQRGGET